MVTPIRATTQSALDIEDVTNNLILLRDGGAAMVLKIKAVNFALLSEEEQDSIIYGYAALLNSLSFPIQVLIRSQKKDITNYIKLLKNQEIKQLNPTLKNRLTQYRQFVEAIVKERNVLDKSFYIIIPFHPTELGITTTNAASNLLPGPKPAKGLPFDKSYIIQKALNILEPKRDHLLRQFPRLNLTARQLQTQELIQLMYTIHNPETSEGIQTLAPPQYHSPITQSVTALRPAPPKTPAPASIPTITPPTPIPPPSPAPVTLPAITSTPQVLFETPLTTHPQPAGSPAPVVESS
jgi:hypothetical protein